MDTQVQSDNGSVNQTDVNNILELWRMLRIPEVRKTVALLTRLAESVPPETAEPPPQTVSRKKSGPCKARQLVPEERLQKLVDLHERLRQFGLQDVRFNLWEQKGVSRIYVKPDNSYLYYNEFGLLYAGWKDDQRRTGNVDRHNEAPLDIANSAAQHLINDYKLK